MNMSAALLSPTPPEGGEEGEEESAVGQVVGARVGDKGDVGLGGGEEEA